MRHLCVILTMGAMVGVLANFRPIFRTNAT